MAQLALAVVGSAIGAQVMGTAVVMGMTGAQMGWMAGALLGSVLFPPKQPDGPRLGDLNVQVSSYGAHINRVWGAARVAGNVIWTADIVEHAHEESSGGKGGGSSYTVYNYTCSFAVSICAGPIHEVRRVWADNKLIFDISGTSTGETVGFTASSHALYKGDEEQEVDPTIQAAMTNTPAYRGQAYWVFTDLELEKFGNRIPNLTFEVVTNTVVFPRSAEITVPNPNPTLRAHAWSTLDPTTGYLWCCGFADYPYSSDVVVYDMINKRVVTVIATGQSSLWPVEKLIYVPDTNEMWGVSRSSLSVVNPIINCTTYAVDLLAMQGQPTVYNPDDKCVYTNSQYALSKGLWAYDIYTRGYVRIADTNATFYSAGVYIEEFNRIVITRGEYITVFNSLSMAVVAVHAMTGWNLNYPTYTPFAYDSSRNRLLITNFVNDNYAFLDMASATISFGTDVTETLGSNTAVVYHPYTDKYYVSSKNDCHIYNAATMLFEEEFLTVPSEGTVYSLSNALIIPPGMNDRLWAAIFHGAETIFLGVSLDPEPVRLSEIVTALSLACGLSANDIDVTELTDGVMGYALARQGSARSALEYLMMAFMFDSVESEGKIKFIKRGKPSVAVFEADDLAVHEAGQRVPAALEFSRLDEVELPRNLAIKYANFGADYQIGVQTAQRTSGRALNEVSFELPITMLDTTAKSIADYALYAAWANRTTAKWTASLAFAHIEPTDVVMVDGNMIRITGRSLQGNILSFDGQMETGISVVSGAATGTAYPVTQRIVVRGATRLALLDVPMLRDEDDDAGFYLATSGYLEGWPGGVVFKSADDGLTYSQIAVTPTGAVIGTAANALGDFTDNMFDEYNTVTVTVGMGELASTTELAVLNGANAAVLGQEIIQFKRATLIDGTTYELSGLLRGRKGSPTHGHAAGDLFVLLSVAGLRRIQMNMAEIGLERKYKGVTLGAAVVDADTQTFTNTARSLECLSPVHVFVSRYPTGDLGVTWTRRTRIDAEWRDLVDVALGETSETYAVEVWDDTYTTLKRQITGLSSSELVYPSASQIADFGTLDAVVVRFKVFQVSASVSFGWPGYGSSNNDEVAPTVLDLPSYPIVPTTPGGVSEGGVQLEDLVVTAINPSGVVVWGAYRLLDMMPEQRSLFDGFVWGGKICCVSGTHIALGYVRADGHQMWLTPETGTWKFDQYDGIPGGPGENVLGEGSIYPAASFDYNGQHYIMGSSYGGSVCNMRRYDGTQWFDHGSHWSWADDIHFDSWGITGHMGDMLNGIVYFPTAGKIVHMNGDPHGTCANLNATLNYPAIGSGKVMAIDDLIYIFGVWNTTTSGVTATKNFSYNPATDTYTQLADSPEPIWGSTFAYLDGVVHVFGGPEANASYDLSDRHLTFTIATGVWGRKEPLPPISFITSPYGNVFYELGNATGNLGAGAGRGGMPAVVHGGKIYLPGGGGNVGASGGTITGSIGSAENRLWGRLTFVYDPALDTTQ